jgi:hypothetical protein
MTGRARPYATVEPDEAGWTVHTRHGHRFGPYPAHDTAGQVADRCNEATERWPEARSGRRRPR